MRILCGIRARRSRQQRHSFLYNCGIVFFTRSRGPVLPGDALDQVGELEEISNPRNGLSAADHDLRIRRDEVRPLRRHRADSILVNAKQQPHPVGAVPPGHADKLLAAQGMERMRHTHKRRCCIRNTGNLWRDISAFIARSSSCPTAASKRR